MNLHKPENIQFLIIHSDIYQLRYFPNDPYLDFNKAISENIKIGRIKENNVRKFEHEYRQIQTLSKILKKPWIKL